MGKIITVYNQKGGVTKTSFVLNVGAILADKGYKTLVIDLDMQANLTAGIGLLEYEYTSFNVLTDKKFDINRAIYETNYENLSIIPSNIELSKADTILNTTIGREVLLRRRLESIKNDYDFIVVDTGPTLNLLAVNALTAADYLIIPLIPQYFSIIGLKDIINTYEEVRDNLNEDLRLLGITLAMLDKRIKIGMETKKLLDDNFKGIVFNTNISTDTQVIYSQDSRTPLIHFNKNSKALNDYINLTDEILRRINNGK